MFNEMDIIVYIQPDMTVDAGSFIEPTFHLRSIHAHDDKVVFTGVDKISYVTCKGSITAEI